MVDSIIGASLCLALVISSLLAGPKAMTPIASAVSVLRRHVLLILACLVVCPIYANAQDDPKHLVTILFEEGYVAIPNEVSRLDFQRAGQKSNRLTIESVTYYDGRKTSASTVEGNMSLPLEVQSLIAKHAGHALYRVFSQEAFDEQAPRRMNFSQPLRQARPIFGRCYYVRFESRKAANTFAEEVQRLSGVEEANLTPTADDYSLDGDVTDVPPNDPNYSQQ